MWFFLSCMSVCNHSLLFLTVNFLTCVLMIFLSLLISALIFNDPFWLVLLMILNLDLNCYLFSNSWFDHLGSISFSSYVAPLFTWIGLYLIYLPCWCILSSSNLEKSFYVCFGAEFLPFIFSCFIWLASNNSSSIPSSWLTSSTLLTENQEKTSHLHINIC